LERYGIAAMRPALAIASLLLAANLAAQAAETPLSREQWGAPPVSVSHASSNWLIAGKRNSTTLNETNLALTVQNGSTRWTMAPSGPKDMLVKSGGKEFFVRLADAKKISIQPYDTGFKTGVKISLAGWSDAALTLYLTICLEGRDEDLVCEVAAKEGETVVRQLDWPTALDAREVDYTLLSNGKGNLLPRDWPKEYFPIRRNTSQGKVDPTDHSVLQSHVIESWSMSWVGLPKGQIRDDDNRPNSGRCRLSIRTPCRWSNGYRPALARVPGQTRLPAQRAHVFLRRR
jgi:hypothetical protein